MSFCSRGVQLWPAGHVWPRMAMNEAQHKIVNYLKHYEIFCSFVFVSVCVFNVWPKTTLLPVWPRDANRLDTPEFWGIIKKGFGPDTLHCKGRDVIITLVFSYFLFFTVLLGTPFLPVCLLFKCSYIFQLVMTLCPK